MKYLKNYLEKKMTQMVNCKLLQAKCKKAGGAGLMRPKKNLIK